MTIFFTCTGRPLLSLDSITMNHHNRHQNSIIGPYTALSCSLFSHFSRRSGSFAHQREVLKVLEVSQHVKAILGSCCLESSTAANKFVVFIQSGKNSAATGEIQENKSSPGRHSSAV